MPNFRKLFEYAKAIAALLGAVLTSVIVTLPEVPLWLAIVSAAVTAVAVYVVPNAVPEDDTTGKHVLED